MQPDSTMPRKVATPAQTPADAGDCRPRKEDEAAHLMWAFYRDHKAQLIADIREHRSSILADLIRGTPVDRVFAPYFKPPERARPARQAGQS